MRRMLALLLAVAAVLVVLWLALHRETPAPALAGSPHAPEAAAPAQPPAKLEGDSPGAPALERIEAESTAERAPAVEGAPAQPASALAELRGRFVLEGGAPAVGAKIAVQGWESNNERVLKYGKPKEEWKELRADCDADGRFALRFDPPRAFQFTLEASYPGCVKAQWRWSEIEPASTKDLGETLLPRGGAIAGRVVDAQGKPTRDAWMVYADALGVSQGDGSDSSRAHASADKETGQFRLADLPPGQVELKAYSEIANWIGGPKVQVRAGETTEANIQYTGPDNSRRITVVTFARPFYIYDSQVAEIALSAPGLEPRKAKKIANSSQSFSFDDVDPGSYSVTIDDPRFKPWRKDGVQPGQRVSAKLVGASAASLAVLDAATRAPVARYSLRVRFDKSTWRPNEFEVFGADRDPPAAGLVDGLIPAEQTLIVAAEGYAPCELPLGELKPGEVRRLTAELGHGTTLVARVLQADGKTPVAGVKVLLGTSAGSGAEKEWAAAMEREKFRETTSGPDGAATFASVAAGTYKLRAEASSQLAAELEAVVIQSVDTRKDVDLVLPASGWLVGRVLGIDAAETGGCSLVILPTAMTQEERSVLEAQVQFDREGPQNPVAADGSFRAGPLRAGKSSVAFQFPQITVHNGPNTSFGMPGATIALGEVEIPAGGELRQEFDLRGKLPGRVHATVRVNGAPAAQTRVSINSGDQGERNGLIQLDADGRGTSTPIAPGAIRFEIGSNDGEWSWTAPGTWTVVSGETLQVQWDIVLASGTLQLVDGESGLPLAEKQVMITTDAEEFGGWNQRATDKDGKVSLRLAPGAYRAEFLFDRSDDGKPSQSKYAATRFDWTANGPVNAVLKVGKKP